MRALVVLPVLVPLGTAIVCLALRPFRAAQRAASVGGAALLLVVAIVALLMMVALPAALRIVDFGPLGAWLTAVGPLLVVGIAVVFVIGALYRYGPHRATARKRWVKRRVF